jgi:hypothetical protein
MNTSERTAVLEVAAGVTVVAADLAIAVVHRASVLRRPAAVMWRHAPARVTRSTDQMVAELSRRGKSAIELATAQANAVIGPLGRTAAESTLREMDLTALVREQVDMVALAREVVDGLDLPSIVRESTQSLTSEAVRGAREQAMHADDAVGSLADRLFGRRHSSGLAGPATPGMAPT